MSFAIASLLKPFAALAFFVLAFLVARGIARLIPSGRVKDLLYDTTIQARYPWRFGLGFLFLTWGVIFLLIWAFS